MKKYGVRYVVSAKSEKDLEAKVAKLLKVARSVVLDVKYAGKSAYVSMAVAPSW